MGQWGRIMPSSSVSTVHLPRYPVDAIARGRPGHGLFINGSHLGEVQLPPWFNHPHWRGLGDPPDFPTDELARFAPS